MENIIAIVGFGEAGRAFAGAEGWQATAFAFDRLLDDAAAAPAMLSAMTGQGVRMQPNLSSITQNCSAMFSLVTADQAPIVAKSVADICALNPKQDLLYLDMNSVAPETKCTSASVLEAAGVAYVDVAIMSPVNPARLNTPLLVSGPHAASAKALLDDAGFTQVRIAGNEVGQASTIKMLRSVMYKGVEALTAECLIACERAGVTDEVLASFNNDWSELADYRLDRMLVHGLRRAAEMQESVKTLRALGVSPMLTEGTVGWQQVMGAMGMSSPPEGLREKLTAILEEMSK